MNLKIRKSLIMNCKICKKSLQNILEALLISIQHQALKPDTEKKIIFIDSNIQDRF